jgi:hypothetical protein
LWNTYYQTSNKFCQNLRKIQLFSNQALVYLPTLLYTTNNEKVFYLTDNSKNSKRMENEQGNMMENTLVLSTPTSDSEILAAIQRDGWYISQVKMTPERCLAAVQQDGLVLRMIPWDLHTVALCLEAVRHDVAAVRYVSKKILNEDICIEAVRKNWEIITSSYCLFDIPDEFRTKELYFEAIKQNSRAILYVPNECKSESFYEKAIMQNGLSLEFVPENILSEKLYALAVRQNGLALEFVPDNKKGENLCLSAVNSNALALEYVPSKQKTKELCKAAITKSWKAFLHVPKSMYTINNCLEILERILRENGDSSEMLNSDVFCMNGIARRFPDRIDNDIQIVRLERQLRARVFAKKHFDKESQKFVIVEKICYREEDRIKEFDSFIDFYKYLEADLRGADLHDYNFKGVCLADFNIDGAYISSSVLVEQGLYDDSFYNSRIKDYDGSAGLMVSAKNEVVDAVLAFHDTDLFAVTTLRQPLLTHKIECQYFRFRFFQNAITCRLNNCDFATFH